MPEPTRSSKGKGLSFREAKEWTQIELNILVAEKRVAACQTAVDDPAVLSDAAALHSRCDALETAQAEVQRLYARWAELEEKRSQAISAQYS